MRRHRRPPDLRRQHHRDRHRLLPPHPHPRSTASLTSPGRPTCPPSASTLPTPSSWPNSVSSSPADSPQTPPGCPRRCRPTPATAPTDRVLSAPTSTAQPSSSAATTRNACSSSGLAELDSCGSSRPNAFTTSPVAARTTSMPTLTTATPATALTSRSPATHHGLPAKTPPPATHDPRPADRSPRRDIYQPAPAQPATVRSVLANIDHGSGPEARSKLTNNRGPFSRTKSGVTAAHLASAC
jgi:hypothetical protein